MSNTTILATTLPIHPNPAAAAAAGPAAIAAAPGRRLRRAGQILTGVMSALLLLDGVGKLLGPAEVLEGTARLGFASSDALTIGIIELTCVLLYLIPRTAILGALLLTGFLGGAVAIHVRIHDPLFTHTLFPTYVATVIWAGLVMRRPQLRALRLFG